MTFTSARGAPKFAAFQAVDPMMSSISHWLNVMATLSNCTQVGLTHSSELEFGLITAPSFDEVPDEAVAPVSIAYAAPTVTSVVSLALDEMTGLPMSDTTGG
jgi:hypothetical protein